MTPQYEIDVKKYSELKNKISVPRFQRGLVWGGEKKKEFIRTLKAGLPIGVLLLSKKSETEYLIIDGLQRFTTMNEYSNNYFSYLEASEITDSDVFSVILAGSNSKDIYDGRSEEDKNRIKDQIRTIIVDNIQKGLGKNFFEISLATSKELCQSIPELNQQDETNVQGAVYRIVEQFSSNASIDDVTVPLIIFTGPDSELANIFQKLNQEGVKLSKYDIFAATWINKTVTVANDSEFIQLIINKYEAAKDQSNLEIENYDPDAMLESGEVTVFEYAFGIGKELKNKCPKLFPGKNDDAKIESIGFLLLAELLGLSYNQMGDLADKLIEKRNLDYKKLKDAIVAVCREVESSLGTYIVSPARGGESLVCHSELQLASYILVLMKLKYEIASNGLIQTNSNAKEIRAVKKYIHKHYLWDILRDFWSGSGDTKLEDIISDPTICRYTKDIPKDSFEQTLSEWIDASNNKTTLTNISSEYKLLLNYLLRSSVDSNEIGRTAFDIEHCAPKKPIQDHLIRRGHPVPISAICNLCYIPSSDNRGKGEYTYYQRQSRDATAYTLSEEQLDKFTYPTKQELQFLNSVTTITDTNYRKFLSDRKNTISNKLMEKLFPE